MYQKGIKILKLRLGFLSNRKTLLPSNSLKLECESLLTDFHRVEDIKYGKDMDAYFSVIDQEDVSPTVEVSLKQVVATGPFLRLHKETSDLRYSLWGNEGFLFRYSLLLLESIYGIYSFHAAGMYEERGDKLFIIVGSAGAGKSCMILKGLELGLKLFSTEMIHFKVEKKRVKFFKGSLADNVRIANLRYNYPEVSRQLGLNLVSRADEWQKKIPVDLSKYQTPLDELTRSEVVIILPRIEEGRKKTCLTRVKDQEKQLRILFENASQKIGETVLLYGTIPLAGLDKLSNVPKRLENIKTFLGLREVGGVFNLISGPDKCWEGLL